MKMKSAAKAKEENRSRRKASMKISISVENNINNQLICEISAKISAISIMKAKSVMKISMYHRNGVIIVICQRNTSSQHRNIHGMAYHAMADVSAVMAYQPGGVANGVAININIS
jgi:hypothetical protein